MILKILLNTVLGSDNKYHMGGGWIDDEMEKIVFRNCLFIECVSQSNEIGVFGTQTNGFRNRSSQNRFVQ